MATSFTNFPLFFFFNDTATTEIYTLSLHDALPIYTAIPASAVCPADRPILSHRTAASWNGWSPSTSNTRYQAAEAAGLMPDEIRKLKLKWALGFPGDVTAFAAPAVWNGTLFVGSAGGIIEAIDAKTGCLYWT